MRLRLALSLAAMLFASGCGGSSAAPSEEEFQSGFQASIEAAAKGQELMKDARPKRNSR